MKKYLLAIGIVCLAFLSSCGAAPAVVSQPGVLSLGESSAYYVVSDMDMIIDGLVRVYEGSKYTVSMYNPQTGEYFMAWKTLSSYINGDAAAFAFYSPKGEVDFSSKYAGARNFLDVVQRLSAEGWVQSPSNYLVPPCIAQVLKFVGSLGNIQISVFMMPAIWADILVIPEIPVIDT